MLRIIAGYDDTPMRSPTSPKSTVTEDARVPTIMDKNKFTIKVDLKHWKRTLQQREYLRDLDL